MARILIIEDEANNLDVAQRIVRGAGHEALIATDGAMGLAVARREHPDAVLVDLLLPKLISGEIDVSNLDIDLGEPVA